MLFFWSGPPLTCLQAVRNGAGRACAHGAIGTHGAPPAVPGKWSSATVPGLAGSPGGNFRRVQGSGPIGE